MKKKKIVKNNNFQSFNNHNDNKLSGILCDKNNELRRKYLV